jgi:hypothetical protein
MKNIHLLPTEKPSKLSILNSGKLNFGAEIMSSSNSKPQHIYITSDEEIKEGDWCYDEYNKVVFKNTCAGTPGASKKIILTTDPDLITDGVQAIDDEFLEWFVKNPNCKFVETKVVDFEVDMGLGDECIEHGNYYKIIIPQEEPNPFELPKALPDEVFYQSLEAKQETLEEAAEKWLNSKTLLKSSQAPGLLVGFIEGASYQAERMYSEEKVIDILYSFHKEENSRVVFSLSGITKWFEQFKKK